MKIVVAPDSFKGSLSAEQICDIVENAAHEVFPGCEVVKVPAADGGEGTVDSVLASSSGQLRTKTVSDALGRPIAASYALLDSGKAVIEMAAASGLPQIAEADRDVMHSSTRGTGELILDALDHGCREIMIGLGGSATNDGGAGMAAALGVRFLNAAGEELMPVPADFAAIERVDISHLDPRVSDTHFVLMSDVRNPLLGEEGATRVYGPQKGVTDAVFDELESGMSHYIDKVEYAVGFPVRNIPGAGAAGGLGAGLLAFTRAEVTSGIEKVLDLADFDSKLRGADLAVTGEGRMDSQSVYGKVTAGVGKRCEAAGVPCLALVGSVGEGAEAMYDCGITSIVPTVDRIMTLREAIRNAESQCYRAAVRMFRCAGALQAK